MSSILIVEDESRIVAFLTKGLKAAGFTTHTTAAGREAVEPDPPVAVDHGSRQPAPAAPAAPAATGRSDDSRTEVDDDDDRKPANNGVREAGDDDHDIDD